MALARHCLMTRPISPFHVMDRQAGDEMRTPVQHDEEPMLPWGTVTPQFWATGHTHSERPVQHHLAAVARSDASLERVLDDGAVGEQSSENAGEDPRPERKTSPDVTAARPEAIASTDEDREAPVNGAAEEPPLAYQDRIAVVVSAFAHPGDRARLEASAIEAEKLDQELTAEYGPQHSHTINIREIRGWLALLAGQPAVATRWYLHTTGLQIMQHGADHELALGLSKEPCMRGSRSPTRRK